VIVATGAPPRRTKRITSPLSTASKKYAARSGSRIDLADVRRARV
jgi:hypothetical protein